MFICLATKKQLFKYNLLKETFLSICAAWAQKETFLKWHYSKTYGKDLYSNTRFHLNIGLPYTKLPKEKFKP